MKKIVRQFLVMFAVLGLVAGFASCSSDDSSSSSASTCDAIREVAGSLRAFGDLNVVDDGANGVETAVEDVRNAVRRAREDASDQFADDFDALNSAIENLRSAISDGRGDQTLTQWLSALGDDAGAVVDAGQELRDSAAAELQDCDLSG